MNSAFWFLDKLLGKKIQRTMNERLNTLARAPERASRFVASRVLRSFAERPGPHVTLGKTDWDEETRIPVRDLVRSHGLITGGSGSGKTMATLLIVQAILEADESSPIGLAVIDGAKSDLYLGALFLIERRLSDLAERDPEAASRFKRRIKIIDFGLPGGPITPFNFLAPSTDVDPESFAGHQVELLLDIIADGEGLKLAASLLKTLVQILSAPEVGMSVLDLIRCLDDDAYLKRVLARCKNATLVEAVDRQLGTLSKATRSALRRRLEGLVSSSTVARMFAGATAPCFSSFQDQSCLVAANCAGPHISGGLTSFLNTLMVSYFCRSLYARRAPEKPFVVIADEAQDLFASAVMREHLADAGRLSRRYGTFFWFITQNLSASISDTRLLRLLHTNTGWTWSGRGDPADNTFLKPVIPVTARRLRPKRSPFEESSFYSDAEERALLLEEIANLPSRAGYFWPKGQSAEAIRVHTADLDIPQGSALEKAVLPMRNDPTVGDRISQQEYEKVLHRKTDRRPADEPGDLNDSLKDNYARSKSGKRKRS